MCGNGTVVKECDTPVPGFPSTMQTQMYITSICDQMTMEGCTECTGILHRITNLTKIS